MGVGGSCGEHKMWAELKAELSEGGPGGPGVL